ncbi:MAG: hypothetical protein KGY69_04120 [Bacteroidales bacterium]|nr:hypothetical protein [Bacteroidales bacterium]
MMKRTFSKLRTTLLLSFIGMLPLTFTSCEDNGGEEDEIQVEGIYIVNEGQFGNNNGSITLFEQDSGKVINNYFEKKNNGRTPGDIVQDLAFSDTRGYVVVNNSKKMEIVDKNTFEAVDVMNSLSYPRQFLPVDRNKGYLTNGSSADSSRGHVLVIDLNEHVITDSIEVGRGPESMIKVDDQVFVTNSGGWKIDNTVSVIDISTDEVTETVEVGDIPTDIVKDKNNDVWVLCKGRSAFQTGGPTGSELVKITSSDYQTSTFDIDKTSSDGNYLLAIGPDEEMLYFVGANGVYEMSISDSNAPTDPIIDRIPYGLDVNPENGNVYCLGTKPQSKGYLYWYDQEYTLKDSIQIGYYPNAVVFE